MSSMATPRLPLELILQISNYIDSPTLVAFLCVCRDWLSLLLPLCYRFISRTQWHHPTFPLRDPARLHDPALAALLAQIHSLEWFSNLALTGGARSNPRASASSCPGDKCRPLSSCGCWA